MRLAIVMDQLVAQVDYSWLLLVVGAGRVRLVNCVVALVHGCDVLPCLSVSPAAQTLECRSCGLRQPPLAAPPGPPTTIQTCATVHAALVTALVVWWHRARATVSEESCSATHTAHHASSPLNIFTVSTKGRKPILERGPPPKKRCCCALRRVSHPPDAATHSRTGTSHCKRTFHCTRASTPFQS